MQTILPIGGQTPPSLQQLRTLYRQVICLVQQKGYTQRFSSYRALLKQLIRSGAYGKSNEQQRLEWERVLNLVLIAVGEMGLGSVSASAILFGLPVYNGHLSTQEIQEVAPEGTVSLISLLMETAEVYLRHKTLSGDDLQPFLLSVAKDVRVVLILIAERLFALRTAKESMDADQRRLLALEVQGLFVPLAHRLGLYAVKSEMEDLILKYTDPAAFYYIKRKLGETKRSREAYMQRFIEPLKQRIDSAEQQWPYEIKARTKSISSIQNKIINKGVTFDNIYDLSAIRIILDTPLEEERKACWYIYSIVTDTYEPNIKRLRDWITHPKDNGYESLQITVTGPENKSVEVQIRTRRMDGVAEQGVAAHWRYKGVASQEEIDATLTSLREALEQVGKKQITDEQALKVDLSAQTVFAFTPTGELIKLPAGATVLDFAFSIHSRVGATAISALVNGKTARLRQKIENGDTISIQTSKNQRPSLDWLNFVVTRKAKGKIRQLLHEQQEKGLQAAKELLERRFKNRRLEYNESVFSVLVHKMGFKGNMEFFIALSEERINVARFLDDYQAALTAATAEPLCSESSSLSRSKSSSEMGGQDEVVIVNPELSGVEYTLAQCCNPRLGDDIFAYPTKQGIRIHSKTCPNALDILGRHGERVLPARWRELDEELTKHRLQVSALDKPDLVARIVSLCQLSPGVHMLSQSQFRENGLWRGSFTLTSKDPQNVHALVGKIQSLRGVQQVDSL